MKKVLVLGALAFILSACRITPLYDTRTPDNTVSRMERISIPPVTGEDGVWGIRLRNRLLDRLTPRGAPDDPRYSLNITLLTPKRIDYTLDRYGTATSYALRVGANYELVETGTRRQIISGAVSSSSSYPILRDQHSSETLRNNAQRLTIEDLADQIYIAIAAWFSGEDDAK